jgi:hypothetical protein
MHKNSLVFLSWQGTHVKDILKIEFDATTNPKYEN